jgi:hypothetical protein
MWAGAAYAALLISVSSHGTNIQVHPVSFFGFVGIAERSMVIYTDRVIDKTPNQSQIIITRYKSF